MIADAKNKAKNSALLISSVVMFFIYYMQGIVYPSGSILSQGCILLYLLIGLYCFYRCIVLSITKPTVLNVWLLFYLLLGITFIISPKQVVGRLYEAIGTVKTFNQFKSISACCLSMFIGYWAYMRAKQKDLKIFAKIGIVFIVLFSIRYFSNAREIADATRGRGAQNNASYLLVGMIPFLPIIFKYYKKIAIASLLLIVALVILASKRGAIVCMVVSLVILAIWYFKTTKLTPTVLIGGILGICVLTGFTIHFFHSNEVLQNRIAQMDKDGIGPREFGYKMMWEHWKNDNSMITQVVGNGTAQSVKVWGNYAHNDWLELLISNGLIGVIIYLSFFIAGFYYYKRLRLDRYGKVSYLLVLMILLLKTIFSMGYTELSAGLDFVLIGSILALNVSKQKSVNKENCVIYEKDNLLDR